jgi:hypothetical protein
MKITFADPSLKFDFADPRREFAKGAIREFMVTGGRRKKANGSPRILPGDWGKAGTGWLARPLWKWFARAMDGGKIHQFL